MTMNLAALYLAQAMCAPHESAAQMLFKEFGEVLAGRGAMLESRGVIELYVSPAGSFTMLAVLPSGVACVMGGGDRWRAADPPKPGKPA